MTGASQKKPNILKAAVIATAVFFFDVYFSDMGIISVIVLIAVLPVMTVRALWKVWRFRDWIEFRRRLVVMGIYLAMIFLVYISIKTNNGIAKDRADMIIRACEQYKTHYGEYPPSFSLLVPEFIHDVPPVKYRLSYNQFMYISTDTRHTLVYVSRPPFGKRHYVLEEKKWGFMD